MMYYTSLLWPDTPLGSASAPHYGPGLWLSDLQHKDPVYSSHNTALRVFKGRAIYRCCF